MSLSILLIDIKTFHLAFLYCIFQYQFNIFNGKYVYDLNIVLAM